MRKRAVDTNVLVRILADNGSEQAVRARALLENGTIAIGPTVLLETEWVLRSRFGLPSAEINRLLSDLLLVEAVQIADSVKVAEALDAHRAGMDFADALHLHLTDCDEFLTFDQDLQRRSLGRRRPPDVREP